MRTLYLFIDDSGNFDFSSKGTNHFVMAGVTTTDPIASSAPLQQLKYGLLAEGEDVECFHASPNPQRVRDRVFEEISDLKNIQYHIVFGDKHKVHPKLQNPASMYSLFGKTLIKYVIKGWLASQFEQIVVIFDKALTKRDENAFLKVVKPELKQLEKPYKIYFHHTMADFNGQIADYGSWSKFVQLTRNEERPMKAVGPIPRTEFDIFNRGLIRYY